MGWTTRRLDEDRLARRQRALAELHELGLRGADAYLLDAVPLLRIACRDGRLSPDELDMLAQHVFRRAAELNEIAGCRAIREPQVTGFLERLLQLRRDPAVLERLTRLLPDLELLSASPEDREAHLRELWRDCVAMAELGGSIPGRFRGAA